VATALLLLAFAAPLRAQDLAVPTVGDSPTALALCRRAEDLRDANPAESARIVQRILAEFGDRLVAADGDEDRFVPASQRAMVLLRESPRVHEEWRRAIASTIAALVEEGEDETLARIASRTPEGADAALRLAQRRLESGRPAAALAMLSLYDPEVLPAPRARSFASSMREAALALLEAHDPDATAARSMHDDGRAWPRIWRLPLGNAPFARRYMNPVTGPLLTVPTAPQAVEDGSLLTVVPLVEGDRVYLCEGHVITAIDRLSRRVRWQRSLAVGDDLEVTPIADASELALAGDTLVVLTGHGSQTRRTGGGRVVALDRATGQTLWERSLAGLEPPDPDGGEGLFPHGRPVIVDDLVVVMARKVNSRSESVGSVIGLDLATGEPRWLTYIAGCGSRPMSGMRAFASPISGRGALFVASSLGAVARLDPATGAIRWLTRSLVPTADGLISPVPWEDASPILTPAGLIAVSPDQSLLLVLDPEDGAVRRRIPLGRTEAWGQPRRLVANRDGSRILAVGDDAMLFDSADLDRPKWRLGAAMAAMGVTPAAVPIRGRVSFVDAPVDGRSVALVPLLDRLLLIDADDGRVLRTLETGRGGNPTLADGQILLASSDRIDCFMPLGSAERAVRDWMARDPDDATRAIALLELGIQCGVPGMIVEGASTAGAALDRTDDPEVRTELVQRILAGAIVETELADDEVRRLLSIALALARRPADRVACALAEGDWSLARGRSSDAVDAWQHVMNADDLRSADLVTEDGWSPASALVLARFASMTANAGPASMAGRERAADSALRALGASPPTGELTAIARTWTGSSAGGAAAIRAAEELMAAGASQEAILLLADALRDRSRLAGMDASVRVLVDAIVASAKSRGWQDLAAAEIGAILDRAAGAGGASQESVDLLRDALRSVAASHPSVRELPSIGIQPSSAAQVRGRLAQLSAQAQAERPIDLALVIERAERGAGPRATLSLRRGPALEAVWQQPVDAEDPEVLAFDDSIVLWQRGPGVEPSMLALASSDGAGRWTIPSVPELFDRSRVAASPAPTRRGLRDGRFLMPQEIFPIRADPWIILARRNGDLVCVDRRDGTVRWRRDGVVTEFGGELGGRSSQVAANAMFVAVGAGRRMASGLSTPVITLLDAERGETIDTIELPTTGDVEWVSIAPGPLVLACVRNSIYAMRPGRSRPVWSRTDHRFGGGVPVIIAGDHQVLAVQRSGSRREELIALDLSDGRVDDSRFVVPPRRSFGPSRLVSVQRVPDGIIAGFTDRVLIFDAGGRLRGQDAVAAEHSYAQVLPARETLVVVDPDSSRSFFANPDRTGSAQPAAVLYQLLRREGGRLAADPIAVPMGDQAADRWLLLDGAVVGSGLDWCTAIPLPVETPR